MGSWCEAQAMFPEERPGSARPCSPGLRNSGAQTAPGLGGLQGEGRRRRWEHVVATWLGEGGVGALHPGLAGVLSPLSPGSRGSIGAVGRGRGGEVAGSTWMEEAFVRVSLIYGAFSPDFPAGGGDGR